MVLQMGSYIKNVFLDHCVDHNAYQAVKKDSSPVFDSRMVYGDAVRFRHIVVKRDENRSQWLGCLKQLHSSDDRKKKNQSTETRAS